MSRDELSELLFAMEFGFKCCERGWDLDRAYLEFRRRIKDDQELEAEAGRNAFYDRLRARLRGGES